MWAFLIMRDAIPTAGATTTVHLPRWPRRGTGPARAVARLVLVATILTAATGCDKAKAIVPLGRADRAEALDLSSRPDILFQVFGDVNGPRMLPIAAVRQGQLQRIVLSQKGWMEFDEMYLRRGKSYTLYRDGRADGGVEVTQGMWERPDSPLYALQGCKLHTPLAAVRVASAYRPSAFTVEYLASTAQIGRTGAVEALPGDELTRIARAIATQAGVSARQLDSLTLRSASFTSGAGAGPTLVAAFVDPAESSGRADTPVASLFLIADRDSTGNYRTTYTHRAQGAVSSADLRRYIDHLDVNGDGIDEIFLEGWTYGGDTFFSVLTWRDEKWTEMYRSGSSWCLDDAKR